MSLPRVHVVTGKGGVGKSTMAAALALAASAGGEVLAVELAQPGGLCRIFGVTPRSPGELVRAADNIALMYVDGAAALAEYLQRHVALRRVLGSLLAHPLYRAFVDAAPGLRELMAVGKVMDEARQPGQKVNQSKRWHTVVLDAGASGHALQHLRMPWAAAKTFGSGRVDREATRLVRELGDPRYTALHVVATPEDMPLCEAAEIVQTINRELGVPVTSVLVNQCRAAAPPGVDSALERLRSLADTAAGGARALIAETCARERAWLTLQERGIADLERSAGIPATRLPRSRAATDLARAAELAIVLAPFLASLDGSARSMS